MKPIILKWTGKVTVLRDEKNIEDFKGEVSIKANAFNV
jgi:hypothetical protein